jgi:DNA replication protein DnaC
MSAPSPSTTTERPSEVYIDPWNVGRGWLGDAWAFAAVRFWRESGVPSKYLGHRLGTFPASPATAAAIERCWAWVDTQAKPALLLHGRFGTGKTGLAVGLAYELLHLNGSPPRFVVVPEMLESWRPGREEEVAVTLGALRTAPLLILDDLGAEKASPWVQERLFMVVNARYNDASLRTVWTSNLAPSALGDHLGERIAWRIVEMSETVRLDGPNLRDRA